MTKEDISRRARELGFAKTYYIKPYASDEVPVIPGLLKDPFAALPAAQTVIVLLMPYAPARETDTREGVISPYYAASNAAYRGAKTLAGEIVESGCQAIANTQFPLKPMLIRSGIGAQGTNSLVHVEGLGSAFHVQTVITDAYFPVDTLSAPADLCKSCGACLRACPVSAIGSDRGVDRAKCLRAVSETEPVPENVRRLLGNRILGCDICQNVCPYNALLSGGDPIHVSLADLLNGNIDELKQLIGSNYARKKKMAVKAAIAAGNLKRIDLIPTIRKLMNTTDEASVKDACVWALNIMEERI